MVTTVFLDRDGVINRNRSDYVKAWDEFEFLPRSLEALHKLAELGHRVVVVTNQSVINRGIVGRDAVEEINRRMADIIEKNGGRIDAVFYCPHSPNEQCKCRKPKPGLFYQAADTLGIDLSRAVMIGDDISDVQAAELAGCGASILVLSGRQSLEQDALPSGFVPHMYVVPDLFGAVEIIEGIGVVPPALEKEWITLT